MFKVPEDYIIILKFSKIFALILWILDTIYITTSYPKYIFNVYTFIGRLADPGVSELVVVVPGR